MWQVFTKHILIGYKHISKGLMFEASKITVSMEDFKGVKRLKYIKH